MIRDTREILQTTNQKIAAGTALAEFTPEEIDTALSRVDYQSRILNQRLHHIRAQVLEGPAREAVPGQSWNPQVKSDRKAFVISFHQVGTPDLVRKFETGWDQQNTLARVSWIAADMKWVYRTQDLLDKEYTSRGGWSRFFLVEGGHVHLSRGCGTCYPTTRFSWLPHLSGATENEMVDEFRDLPCTVCFPSAPVYAATLPPKEVVHYIDEKGKCSSIEPTEELVKNRRGTSHGTCAHCGKRFVNSARYGKLHPHQAPNAKEVFEADRQAFRKEFDLWTGPGPYTPTDFRRIVKEASGDLRERIMGVFAAEIVERYDANREVDKARKAAKAAKARR